ncbi:dihydroorotase [Babesia gibsoni]|uniref:dihydroorotase n=1 Tax=Babesia gibsoni TaxID=33632 RepID=A0AAD8PH40_BABGI|nr:dihydroorotase [Babesia gibsoni]
MVLVPFADDLHCHLRQGEMMGLVTRYIRQGGCDRVLVMPNTIPPITSCAQAGEYRRQLLDIEPDVSFLMTLYLSHEISIADLRENAKSNYVQGSLEEFYPIFSEMEKLGLSLHVHGEKPGESPLHAEEKFITNLENVARAFPRLKVVAEHVSTKACIEAVERTPNLAATITAHHLFITVNDVLNKTDNITLDNINEHIKDPHLYCKPLAKTEEDREALREVIKTRSKKFFLGSDSAPHTIFSKQSENPPAGVFTQPFLMNYLATIFKEMGCMDYLEDFTSKNGAEFLGLQPKEIKWMKVLDESFTLPNTIEDMLVPFMAGQNVTKIDN